MSGLAIALAFLTRLPTRWLGAVPGADTAPRDSSAGPPRAGLSAAAPWLPATGALIGTIVALAVSLGALVSPWVAALAGLVAWIAVTGALHLDGLGDVADALGAAHRDPERFVAVLRDPHAGSFAITAIGVQLLAKLVLLHELAGVGWRGALAVVAIAAWARWGVLIWAAALPPLRPGLGTALAAGITPAQARGNGIALAMASLLVAPLLLLAPLVVWALLRVWRNGIGAINGDGHGANIEITETVLLVLAVIGFAGGVFL